MYIASIANDLKIHVWPNGQLLHTYKSNLQGCVKSISWSKDGSWLILVPSKGPAEIISVRDNLKHLHSIQDIQQPTCAAFQNTTKRNIALGTTTGAVLIYDIKSKNVRKHFPRAPSTVFKVEYSAKDSFLLAACENGEALLYNSVTYNLSSSYKLPNTKTISAMRCHLTRRNLLATGSHEGIVGVWDIHTNKLIYHNQAHAAAITDLTFSPLRSDLIVTTGFDRKLAFYDMTKKNCLIQTILERSPTAIDFCPDGVGIAVGLQDGTIHAYDTRQLNDALYTFKGHNQQIKQILFQKCAVDSSSFEYTFTNESNDSGNEIGSPKNDENSKHSFNSFSNMLCGDVLPDIPEVPTDVCSEIDGGDSFIDAIGLNSNNATGNSPRDSIPSISESGKKRSLILEAISCNSPLPKPKTDGSLRVQEMQRRISEGFAPNKFLNSLQNPLNAIKAQEVSTPKFTSQEGGPQMFVSPIIAASNLNTTSNINNNELQNIIRDTIKKEMKVELEAFQQELKYEFMDVLAQMRRHFLDLQMAIVKEFVQMETRISRIKEEFGGEDDFGEECLIQENIKLRKELAALREQTVTNSED